jgi:transcriptional regulator with XRE-family HTH domain
MDLSNMRKIGDRIRVCRVEKKLNQENVATDIGISITAYSKIERGLTNVSVGRLEQIATCLGVPLIRLMHSSEEICRNTCSFNTVCGDDPICPRGINKQTLLAVRVENMQEELARLQKTIAEKDEIIALLKDMITRDNQKKKNE